jgi:D-glycerate 3-kinase
LSALAETEALPVGFPESFLATWQPYIAPILSRRAERPGMFVIGLCGPQGSGKSTIAQGLRLLLSDAGLCTEILALDDLYLGRAERRTIADNIHPLLLTRGPPGTHDVAMGIDLIDRLAKPGPVLMPRFDKATDDRCDPATWPTIEGPADLLIFEGWCVGATPQDDNMLADPINDLEFGQDAQAIWRHYVNHRLATDYAALFARVDYLIQLRAPSFDIVTAWRTEQEHKLRDQSPGHRTMDDATIARFIQHYERISRYLDTEMPTRADLVLRLDENRGILS